MEMEGYGGVKINLFRRLGKFINRHNKLVIVVWILVFILSMPFASMVLDAVDYSFSTGGTEDLQAVQAQAYINEHFGNGGSGNVGSIILIDSEPEHIYDQNIKSAIFNLTDQIQQASKDGKFKDNVTVTNVYTALYDYSVVYIEQMAPLYSLGENLSVAIPIYLYDVPMGYWESFNNTQDTLLMEFGVPDIYYQSWLIENESGGSIVQIDARAYADAVVAIQENISARPSLNQTEIKAVWLYFDYFSSSWNSTASNPVFTKNPSARLQKAMFEGYTGFIEDPFIKAQGDLFRLYLTVVHDSFDLSNYTNFHRISTFNDIIFEGIFDVLISLLPQEYRPDALLYYDTFYQQWNASTSVPTVVQFHGYTDAAANTVIGNASELVGHLVQVYYYDLGWDQRDNTTAINQLTVQILAESTETAPWLVQTIINLGPDPDNATAQALAAQIVANTTVPNYPMLVLPLIPLMLVGGQNESTLVMVVFYENGKPISGVQYVEDLRKMTSQAFSNVAQTDQYITGVDAMTYDSMEQMDADLAIIDPVAIILILILIGLFFNSLLAAGLPPLSIGIAVGISFSILFFIATYLFSVNYFVITLMITASLGAGCDYCIFMLSRYREERRKGKTKEEAVEEAVTWAGETVTTSGITVIIGFGALFIASLDMVMSFGTLAIGIVLALLIALTLIPALLSIFGDKLFWPSKKIREPTKIGIRYFTHAAEYSMKHAKVLLVVAVVLSIPAIYLVATTPTSYDFVETMPPCESKQGMVAMQDTFGAGMINPTSVALNMTGSVYDDEGHFNVTMLDAIERISTEYASVPGISKLYSPTRPYGEPIDYANLSTTYTVEAAQEIAVMHSMIGKGNNSVMINIIFQQNPYSDNAMDSILQIRSIAAAVPQSEPLINAVYVGGGTALMYDFASSMSIDFERIIALAIVLIYIVLMFVLGSVLNPLRSILTILLSIFWTLAITSLVFQWTMDMYLNFQIPLILIVVCLGLGMDYDILLSTRIREEVHKGMSTNDAIKHSLLETGGIITACGVIMASAFGSMILTGNPMLMQFGLALMLAILLDATVVRTYLVPAIMSLLGKWNWWAPKWIQRKGEEKQQAQTEEKKG